VDVMDAHFVPNLAYSADVVSGLRRVTELPLDVHLMMDNPETMLDAFLDAGASCVTIHAEIRSDISAMLEKIRKRGRMSGIALKPGTSLGIMKEYFRKADLVLMMTVEPGFGGQKLDERVIEKIRMLKEMGYKGEIEADGGINEKNLEILVENGLSVAVMGTALFRNPDMEACVKRLHSIGA